MRWNGRVSGRVAAIGLAFVLLASACGAGVNVGGQSGASDSSSEGAFHPDGFEGAELPPIGLFDPVDAGEQTPNGFRQLLTRDAIFPVYKPKFLRPDQVDWPDEELVIGVEIDGDARAYPVGFLNHREIVVDMHRGIPTFVTW